MSITHLEIFPCFHLAAPRPTTMMPGEGTCDSDWLAFGSHCYKFDITSAYASRVEAEYDCEQNGAQLASIHSKQENEFIRANAFTSVGLRSVWIDMIRGFDGMIILQYSLYLLMCPHNGIKHVAAITACS